jgi:hypothetical protein
MQGLVDATARETCGRRLSCRGYAELGAAPISARGPPTPMSRESTSRLRSARKPAVFMVQAGENGTTTDKMGNSPLVRREPPSANRRLHAKAAMRAAVVVANVLPKNGLSVSLIADEHMVEAIAAERSDEPFTERCSTRGAWRNYERASADVPDALTEVLSVDGVAVAKEEPGRLIAGISDGVDELLGRVLCRGRAGDADLKDLSASELDEDECVEDFKTQCHDDEEVEAQVWWRWLRRKVDQDWPRWRGRCAGRSFATVRGET